MVIDPLFTARVLSNYLNFCREITNAALCEANKSTYNRLVDKVMCVDSEHLELNRSKCDLVEGIQAAKQKHEFRMQEKIALKSKLEKYITETASSPFNEKQKWVNRLHFWLSHIF